MKHRNINKLLLTIYICAGSTFAVYAQTSTEAVLRQIETNNPQLKAAAAEVEAEKLANRADALLENPEFEFNYLWGADGIGNRRDFRVTPSVRCSHSDRYEIQTSSRTERTCHTAIQSREA